MIGDEDFPFQGIGEKDRIRKPTRFTPAQLGIMAAATLVGILGIEVGLGVLLVLERPVRAGVVMAGGLGLAATIYQSHWRYRRRD